MKKLPTVVENLRTGLARMNEKARALRTVPIMLPTVLVAQLSLEQAIRERLDMTTADLEEMLASGMTEQEIAGYRVGIARPDPEYQVYADDPEVLSELTRMFEKTLETEMAQTDRSFSRVRIEKARNKRET